MIKRFRPKNPDGSNLIFELPQEYILGTEITLFVNGQLLVVQDDNEHPYGYYLDPIEKIFTFYIPPYSSDFLYVMYELPDLFDISFENIDWTKKIKKSDFSNKIVKSNWATKTNKSNWKIKTNKSEWKTNNKEIEWEIDTEIIQFTFKSCN